jgi:saposin
MKIQIFISLVAFFALTSGVFVPPRPGHKRLINSKECTWGPTYWCQNLTTAANCRAVKHCIQTVWIHKELPPDSSSVCQTCLDMVKQARDQLESNETQELIKEVFEGSCALLHFKTIVKECDKIADEYIQN